MGKFRRRCRSRRLTELVFAAFVVVFASALPGWSNDLVLPYQLEVYVNGHPKNLVMGFRDDGNGAFSARPDDLASLGIVVPDTLRKQDTIPLSTFGTFKYDEPGQKMYLEVAPGHFVPVTVDASGENARQEAATSATGAVLNYAFTGSASQYLGSTGGFADSSRPPLDLALTGTFEGRVFSPKGLFELGAIAGSALVNDAPVIRLDTAWQAIDESNMTIFRAGDSISGPLAWTRPIRFAGVQYQRNLALRPDLVTLPLPVVTGTAAVPSTVDIFIDNVRTYSRDIAAGPFTINNVPVVGNGGVARVVIRDASGRITETTTSFYTAPQLLKTGLFDFSVEAGLPRRNFGTYSFDYQPEMAASASGRYGWSDSLTLEGHAEAGLGIVNTGLGAITPIGRFALANAAGSVSASRDGTQGARLFSGVQTTIPGFSVSGSLEVHLGRYTDLATASTIVDKANWPTVLAGQSTRAQATLTISAPVPYIEGNASFSVVESLAVDAEERRIFTSSYARRITDRSSFYISGTYDVTEREATAYLGLSMSLQDRQTASISGTQTGRSRGVTAEYARFGDGTPGSFGWRTTLTRGSSEALTGGLTYQGHAARADAYAVSTKNSTFATAYITGAIATIDGEVYTAANLNDGFAVVDVGHPGIDVLLESRPIGKTDKRGRVFVPDLRSHANNQVSIDPRQLPPDVQPSEVKKMIVPMRKSGTIVNMKVKPAGSSALVEFVREDGTHVPLGSPGRLGATNEDFIVGFDGQAYFETLAAANEVTIELEGGPCKAAFGFTAKPGEQVFIEKVVCK